MGSSPTPRTIALFFGLFFGVFWVFVYIVSRVFGMNGFRSGRFWGSFRGFAVFYCVWRMTPPPPLDGFPVAWMREWVSGFGAVGGWFI